MVDRSDCAIPMLRVAENQNRFLKVRMAGWMGRSVFLYRVARQVVCTQFRHDQSALKKDQLGGRIDLSASRLSLTLASRVAAGSGDLEG